jgi:septal ring factor EnvC (AmiA/AmiB activator)
MANVMLSQGPQQVDQVTAQAMRRRLVITLVAALVLICAGWITLWAAGGSPAPPTPHVTAASAASRRPSDELLETTKGLQATQQQAVDQLQVVQDQLVAQQAETKRLSEQIVTLTERLDALQQSIANLPPTTNVARSPAGSAAKSTLRPNRDTPPRP